jgi:hypothetical protein
VSSGNALAAVEHVELRRDRGFRLGLLGAFLRASVAVQNVGAGDVVVAPAHQAQFHLVLHVLDVERAAARAGSHQRAHDCLRQHVHGLAHAGRRGALRAVHGKEGLHHGDGNLVRLERNHGAIAANDLVVGERVGGGLGGRGQRGWHRRRRPGERKGSPRQLACVFPRLQLFFDRGQGFPSQVVRGTISSVQSPIKHYM